MSEKLRLVSFIPWSTPGTTARHSELRPLVQAQSSTGLGPREVVDMARSGLSKKRSREERLDDNASEEGSSKRPKNPDA